MRSTRNVLKSCGPLRPAGSFSRRPRERDMRMRLGKSFLRSAIVYAYLAVSVAGCATAPLDTSGALSSYADLAPEEGVVTKTKLRVDKASVLKAQSVAIMPASISRAASQAELT